MTVLPQNANRANATHDPGIKPRVVYQLDELVRADRRFSTIYADPPWAYRNRSSRAAAINHYATLSVNEICALPVAQLAQLAAANAHLHLWSTVPLLEDTLIVLRAWGFSYKPCFVWVKEQLDMGNYWRVSHELLLLGVRGRRPFRRPRTRSWLRCRRSIHSRKSLIAWGPQAPPASFGKRLLAHRPPNLLPSRCSGAARGAIWNSMYVTTGRIWSRPSYGVERRYVLGWNNSTGLPEGSSSSAKR